MSTERRKCKNMNCGGDGGSDGEAIRMVMKVITMVTASVLALATPLTIVL